MLYVNVNENYGEREEFDSLDEMEEAIRESDLQLPEDGLQEGRDYVLRYDEEEEREFVEEFSDNMPEEYDLDNDLDSPRPWATPWEWDSEFTVTDNPRGDAREFAERVYDEVEELLEEERNFAENLREEE